MIHFWLIKIVLSGIKSGSENVFESLGSQKVDFHVFLGKIHFSVENRPSFSIENLGTYFSIFHDFRSWASFSLHFWIIPWMSQVLITKGIITIVKKKYPLCV